MTGTLRKVLIAMLLGMALYVAYGLYTGYEAIRASLASFHWSAFAAALGLASFNYGLRFLKWEYYLRRLEIRGVPKLDSLLIFLSGFVLTVSPGKVGEVFKSAVLEETHRVPLERTAPIVIAERLTDVIGVVVLIAFGSASFSGGLGWALAGGALVLLGLGLIFWRRPSDALLASLERHPKLGARLAPRVREGVESLRAIATPSSLLLPSALSVLAWGCEGLALQVLLLGFGSSAPLGLSLFFYSTATLAGAIIPVPGGLGVTEGLLREQLFHLGQVPEGVATSAMILVRFATLWWAVLVGFAALALLKARFPRLLTQPSAEVRPGAR